MNFFHYPWLFCRGHRAPMLVSVHPVPSSLLQDGYSALAHTSLNLEADPGLQARVAGHSQDSGSPNSELLCKTVLCSSALGSLSAAQAAVGTSAPARKAHLGLLHASHSLTTLTGRTQNKGLLPSHPSPTLLEVGEKQVQEKERGAHLPLGGRGETRGGCDAKVKGLFHGLQDGSS